MTKPNGFDVLLNIKTKSEFGYTFAMDEMNKIISDEFITIHVRPKNLKLYNYIKVIEPDRTCYMSINIVS